MFRTRILTVCPGPIPTAAFLPISRPFGFVLADDVDVAPGAQANAADHCVVVPSQIRRIEHLTASPLQELSCRTRTMTMSESETLHCYLRTRRKYSHLVKLNGG